MKIVGILAVILLLCGCKSQPAAKAPVQGGSPRVSAAIRFTDVTKDAGVDFVHVNGAYGRKLMPETVGSGCAFADFNGDGFLDLLIVNGTNWPGQDTPKGICHLYRGNGAGGFTDVTMGSGIEKPLYGMGAAVADYDGDGDQDIYLTAVGPNRLLRNDADFHFTDVTEQAQVAGIPPSGQMVRDKWSTGAAWLDYDRDGDLDLFVCQYVKWSPKMDPYCGRNGVRGYCPPDNFEGVHSTLYRSNGDGTFSDVSLEEGLLDGAVGKSFGIGIDDYNRDGWPDVVVTNDTWANFLFMNQQGKGFTENGIESGIAFGPDGRSRAGMGIDVGDFRNDGSAGVVIGNFVNEGLSLFVLNPEGPIFTEEAPLHGITSPSLLSVTFATFLFDADLDGWLDLFATNGHVDDIANTYQSGLTFRQEPLLFRNEQGRRFENVTRNAGFTEKFVGRGAVYGDIDGDGDLDIGLTDNGGKFRLFRNDTRGAGNWLRIRLVGTGMNRDALGARVTLTAGGMTQSRYVKSGGSFLSESERTLTFGMGTSTQADKVVVIWPRSGQKTETGPLSVGKTHILQEKS